MSLQIEISDALRAELLRVCAAYIRRQQAIIDNSGVFAMLPPAHSEALREALRANMDEYRRDIAALTELKGLLE